MEIGFLYVANTPLIVIPCNWFSIGVDDLLLREIERIFVIFDCLKVQLFILWCYIYVNIYRNSVVESSFALMKFTEVLMNVYLPFSFDCWRKWMYILRKWTTKVVLPLGWSGSGWLIHRVRLVMIHFYETKSTIPLLTIPHSHIHHSLASIQFIGYLTLHFRLERIQNQRFLFLNTLLFIYGIYRRPEELTSRLMRITLFATVLDTNTAVIFLPNSSTSWLGLTG